MENDRINTSHIDILDGIRAFSVIIVMLFHFWQQSWYNKVIYYPWFDKFGIRAIDLDWLWRTGYVFVDMMILISGFLLFIPYARNMVEGSKIENSLVFYKKRFARIVPSYYICILILLFVFILPNKEFGTVESLKKDLFAQLTFTQMGDPVTKNTAFNGVLWTVAVEVQFYLIFPLVAFFFKKRPIVTYICMVITAYLYIRLAVIGAKDLGFMINQMPTFLGVYANGMMGALIFVNISNVIKRNKYITSAFTVLSLLLLYMIKLMLKYSLLSSQSTQIWQVEYRFTLSLVFVMLIISLALSAKWLRFIFSNRVVKFLSAISFNLYIWHQMVAIRFKFGLDKNKKIKIPNWEGNTPPNQLGDKEWQLKYLIIIIVTSILIATIMTYLFERPVANLILGKRKVKERVNKPIIDEEDIEVEVVS